MTDSESFESIADLLLHDEDLVESTVGERVLTVPGHVVDDVSGILYGPTLLPLLHDILDPDHFEFVDRDDAEEDESRKQLIPYVLIRRKREFFVYERTSKGGEARLHGKLSLGVGGHINDIDGSYEEGIRRELREELGLEIDEVPAVSALLYDPSERVGRVHLGLVHVVDIDFKQPFEVKDDALTNGRFVHATELRHIKRDCEKWSQLVIDYLDS